LRRRRRILGDDHTNTTSAAEQVALVHAGRQ
jgi:hypothetical protein